MFELKKYIAPALAAAFLAIAPMTASAATVVPTVSTVGVDLAYDYGVLASEANDTSALNLEDASRSLLEMIMSIGSGSLTILTYVDPFAPSGGGVADILFSSALAANSVTVQWGGGTIVDLSDGNEHSISTVFTGAGEVNGKNLIFTWSGLEQAQQVSAAISAVPVPAAGFLLLGALGGLGFAGRRRRKAA